MSTKPRYCFYGNCGSLGDVGVIVKNANCDYVVMLVYSRFG
jgi:hypothetical protein